MKVEEATELADWDFAKQVQYWVGRFALAVGGRESIDNVVGAMKMYYQNEAYERGFKAGKASKGKK